MSDMQKSKWSVIINALLTMLTAILSGFGLM